jgi:hypothetical protein
MFRVILFFVVSFPIICLSQTCSELFQTSNVMSIFEGNLEVKASLEKILLNTKLIDDVTEIRRKYDEHPSNMRMGATVEILRVLEPLREISYDPRLTPTDEKILEIGMDNIMQDLTQISPRYISTQRILQENIAVIWAMRTRESIKEIPVDKQANVVRLSAPQFKNNSDYVSAKRLAWDLIESYHSQKYIPASILHDRVDELLRADLRYEALRAESKFILTERIVKSLENSEHESVESILEKFFATQERERTL